ncbi:hypothetical protein HXX76_011416 [Chlamydomonas incerta]|uniref:Uncharacterized protein n=1 Tax=Chlamydomonas incerta TaxID=51695 RepID=A0A835VTI0_CHLIN|nr:hypothetical protein HXX76_011416 [Chlamydomonas incerta]|eukprot:KAG2428712.1 hypothetical protein HXX76_011416 [Chlamydomonas incerta]
MVAAVYRILDWRPSEARQNAEVFVGRACMVVLGGAVALVASQALAMLGMLGPDVAKLAGNAATYSMLAGFAGVAMGACLTPPVLSHQTHGHGYSRGTEASSGEVPGDSEQGQKPV